jgi:hypothetical protein
MEKNIKDYLHLYIGCNVQWNKARGFTLTKVNWLFNEFEIDQDESGYTETFNEKTVHEIKPILRPLSDMTGEVLTEIFDVCYRCVYSSERDFPVETVSTGFEMGMKAFDGKYNYGLTVNVTGILFSVDGKFLTVPVFDVTRILLREGYDLFDLLDAGLAINKSSITEK